MDTLSPRSRIGLAVSTALGLATLLTGPTAIAQNTGQPRPATSPETERRQMQERIDSLEQRIAELESSTVMSEPETRVRKKEVWVDENGVEHDEPVPGAKKKITYQRETAYRRQAISEKIEEALKGADESKVQIGVDGNIVMQYLSQTKGEKIEADGHAYELASADLFFTAKLAQNTVFFADVVGFSGSTPDEELVGSPLALNGYGARLEDPDEVNLREAWIQTELFDQRLTLVGGRLDLTNYFDTNRVANDETTQFIADPLVVNPALGLSSNGAGLTAIYDPKGGLTFTVGVQQSSEDAKNLSESIYSLAEVGYRARFFGLQEGNYRVWYRRDDSTGVNQDAFGANIDQKLTPSFSIFARFGRADSGEDYDRFYSAGFQFQKGWVINPEDAWGLGVAKIELADGSKEILTEVYYNLHLADRLRLSAHLQYAEESAEGGEKIAYIVPGLRFQASF
ncbi:MAG TPA: carbohydrate porin [Steroidobacteraceae bacterium]|nr:carbohydrate porin [Steroidobacteraceae bacterium]